MRWRLETWRSLCHGNVEAALCPQCDEYKYAHDPRSGTELQANLEESIDQTDSLMIGKLDEYVAPSSRRGIEVSVIRRLGSPREIIVQVSTSIQADLLI